MTDLELTAVVVLENIQNTAKRLHAHAKKSCTGKYEPTLNECASIIAISRLITFHQTFGDKHGFFKPGLEVFDENENFGLTHKGIMEKIKITNECLKTLMED